MKKLEKTTNTNLKKITEMIRKGDLLLPDFQRGFVWKEEMAKSLIASVLAKMPIGSILLLEAKTTDYGCRIPGRKDEPDSGEPEREVYVLLDGQQRLTVLSNVFSNLLYYDYRGGKSPDCDYSKIISTELLSRYFLKIPSVDSLDGENDRFRLKNLSFFPENPECDIPNFLTGDILPFIECYRFDRKTEEAYAPHAETLPGLKRFCIRDDCYLIPLYLLLGDSTSETRLKAILNGIVEAVVEYRLENEYDAFATAEERECLIRTQIEDDYREEILEAGERQRDILKKKWVDMGETHWADRMKQYLLSCVNKLDLHQIIVASSDRNRAIDIYENLNMGGIALSTFELILAKAAKRKNSDGRNLYDAIVEYVQTPRDYDRNILSECQERSFADFIADRGEYSASEAMGCLDSKKNRLNKKYTDAFLNVLCLVSNFPDYAIREGAISVSYIKRPKILELGEDAIWENYERACTGIDRAYFFLQARCGIRSLGEINYELMVVLLGYVLAWDEFYRDRAVIQLLDTWYWTAVFSGRYDKDQNENLIADLVNIRRTIADKADRAWLSEMKTKVFAMPGFSDENTLLMHSTVPPKKVLRQKICQFYLSKTYMDLRTDEVLGPFSESADTLEEHHIVPIGSLMRTYKNMEKAENKSERDNPKSIFNSPLNFALITKKSNTEISNQNIDYYIRCCRGRSIFELNIETTGEEYDAEKVCSILKKRFDKTKTEVEERINRFL